MKASGPDLASARCFFHSGREAAARCKGCGRFLCRECATEHRGKLLCAVCLEGIRRKRGVRSGWVTRLARWGALAVGLSISWLFFWGLGRWLVSLPPTYHELGPAETAGSQP